MLSSSLSRHVTRALFLKQHILYQEVYFSILIHFFLFTAVRFGRVPKREKARIMAAMQNVQHKTLEKTILLDLEDEIQVTSIIIEAYKNTCEYTVENIYRLRVRAVEQPRHSYDPDFSVSFRCQNRK